MLIMGILNCTPDSFSDGGQFDRAEAAIAHGLKMFEEGADWVDVGGESTRPGAATVPVDEELARTIPVVEALAQGGVPVSIDTRKAEVARRALEAGATWINDVSGFRDPAMFELAAKAKVRVCINHMAGTPETMQQSPTYQDVVSEVRTYLLKKAEAFQAYGLSPSDIFLDPGIGFGKNLEHNLALLSHLKELASDRFPVLIGVSRKRFLGEITGAEIDGRDDATLAAQCYAQLNGVSCIRTHRVKSAVHARAVISALSSKG